MNPRLAAQRAAQGFGPVCTDAKVLAAVAAIVFDDDEDPGTTGNRGPRKSVPSSTTRRQTGSRDDDT